MADTTVMGHFEQVGLFTALAAKGAHGLPYRQGNFLQQFFSEFRIGFIAGGDPAEQWSVAGGDPAEQWSVLIDQTGKFQGYPLSQTICGSSLRQREFITTKNFVINKASPGL
ncbi:hypothetical protein GCM10027098_22770 [Bowmanella dokdonensis]